MRVIAITESGEAKTEVKPYTKLPSVLPGEVLEPTSTGATLAGDVNPDFLETEYTFYIADKQQYEHGQSGGSIPVPPAQPVRRVQLVPPALPVPAAVA